MYITVDTSPVRIFYLHQLQALARRTAEMPSMAKMHVHVEKIWEDLHIIDACISTHVNQLCTQTKIMIAYSP